MNGTKRWLLFFSIVVAYWAILYWLYTALGQEIPKLELWPLWLAPALTFATAALTFLGMVRAYKFDSRVVQLNAGSIIIVAMLCLMLAVPASPEIHIAVVIFLFGYFWLWDFLMVKWLGREDRTKLSTREIETASRLINKPTFFAFVILLILVLLHKSSDMEHLFVELTDELFSVGKARHLMAELINCEAEVFVSGAIAFHLLTASLAYLLTRELEEKAKEGVDSRHA